MPKAGRPAETTSHLRLAIVAVDLYPPPVSIATIQEIGKGPTALLALVQHGNRLHHEGEPYCFL